MARRFEEYSAFSVVRLRKGRGKDKPGDWFGVRARGTRDLVDSKESHPSALITAFNSRDEAERLVGMLESAWNGFHKGI